MSPADARRRGRVTVLAAVTAAAVLTGVLVALRAYLGRPFWYDEIWRAHFVSEPLRSSWSELTVANTPSAFGWLALTRVSGEVFGWHSWSLRLPGFVAVPLLGAAIVVLARRFTGLVAAGFAACWLCLNSTFLDLATQLKPYAMETAATVAIVLLWLPGRSGVLPGRSDELSGSAEGKPGPACGRRLERGRLLRRTAAGVLGLLAVPGVFVIVPLAVVDVWRGPARRWRFVEGLPALVLAAAHTVVFVAHQSSQRHGDYWDRQFLAGRGPLDAVRFVADQVRQIVTGSPPGIDRFDPSLLHGTVVAGPFGALPAVLAAVMVVAAGLVGTVTLARHPDGRTLLAVLGGAELMMLTASAARYWPFGPTRTNLFVVPMMVVVVVVGAERVIRWLVAMAGGRWAVAGAEVAADGPRAAPPTLAPPGIVSATSLSAPVSLDVADGDRSDTQGTGGSPASAPAAGALAGGTRVGAATRMTRGRAGASTAMAVVVILALSGSAGLLLAATTSGSGSLWDHRERLRGLDLLVDATVAARQAARPGDVVAVGGRLARPGWLYAMEASDDGPRDPADLRPVDVPVTAVPRLPAAGAASTHRGDHGGPRNTAVVPQRPAGRIGAVVDLPAHPAVQARSAADPRSAARSQAVVGHRVARADTVFFGGAEPPLLRQLAARSTAPGGLLVFVFDIERSGLTGQLDALRRAGWCPTRTWTFRLTGTLSQYDRCGAVSPPRRALRAES
ncbi:conserved membrane hypothetical protein [Frankia canadensis]|uniref:Glycosyltransferase RgtA/B/C/D-like domain-containing protein n=1 Tax=Frankia canadensis TaxID=1836972 RepID=A0A2I2L0I7_9ACTN|nr:hypothetical protein [Frankia canadensis]SNQ51428.1 conserved membrane hypothetical protein [Frankia canadensis]SOU58718.1 conserved membrane hypothetical protein [Frankia canadensis]